MQGGGIKIPCAYEVKVKTGLRQLRKGLKESLQRLTPTAANVDYSKTDSFQLVFKTITCSKFLQTKSVYVFTFVAILLTSNGPCTVHV